MRHAMSKACTRDAF